MLKGFAITPPIVGRISIGKVVEKNGKRFPEKSDQFELLSLIQTKDGWVNHPLDQILRKGAQTKLRSIPVRVLFNDPDLNLRASYHYFDRNTGRPLCVGNGETCKRSTAEGIKELPCPGPDACHLGQGGLCKPYGRINVLIGDEDDLGSFIFRTTGYNSIRTLAARLRYFAAVSGGNLTTLPLELRLRSKSTTQSRRAPIYYVDMVIRTGMTLSEAVLQAKQVAQARQEAGIDQAALDEAARQCFRAGAFEESAEEGASVVDEFYPDKEESGQPTGSQDLAAKLNAKAIAVNGKLMSLDSTSMETGVHHGV